MQANNVIYTASANWRPAAAPSITLQRVENKLLVNTTRSALTLLRGKISA